MGHFREDIPAVEDSLGKKDDLVVRTSSASAISGGTDELGALQNEAGKKQKMGLLPIGNNSQILQ